MSDDIQLMQRSLERERLARKKAESLLEMREAELLDRHHELTKIVSIMRGQLEMLEDAVNSMTVAIVTMEVDGTVRLFNRNAQKLFGLAAEEVLGTSFRSLMPQLFSRENVRRLSNDLLLGQVKNIEQALGRRRDGSEIHVNLDCHITVKKDCRRLILLINSADVESGQSKAETTKERKTECTQRIAPAPAEELLRFLAGYEQLRSQKNKEASADELIKRIDSLIDGLITSSFEGGLPDAIKYDRIPAPTELFEYATPNQTADTVENTATEMASVNDSPATPSMEPSDEEPHRRKKRVVTARSQFSQRAVRKQADVNELLENAVDEFKERWSSFAKLEIELEPELPKLPGDRRGLGNVLRDLLMCCSASVEVAINEAQYEKGTIAVSASFDGERIEIRIKDNGVGLMSIAHMQMPAVPGHHEEINIQDGLAECQTAISEKYDGEICMRTAPKQGTIFEMMLPTAQ